MKIDEITISKAVIQSFMRDFLEAMEMDVGIAGAGPAGMTAAYYLAKEGVKTAVFERQLRVGGGMPGGGMMFNRAVIDATGHGSEICHIVVKKIGPKLNTRTGGVIGEKSMWAEVGEKDIIENTKEVYPGLIVAGMAANAVYGSPRMGAIFGGMLLSGKRAAEVAMDILSKK